jgi:uncharacterized protein
MHDSCDSYVVVEYNGDVYPCDFFVEKKWRIGNVTADPWPEMARRYKRRQFAANKSIPHPQCDACEYQYLCQNGCPKHRHDVRGSFDDLDYFCTAYKMIFEKTVAPLKKDVEQILRRQRTGLRS